MRNTGKSKSVTEFNNTTLSDFVTTGVNNIQSTFSNETSAKSKAYTFLYDIKNFVALILL
jgi:hypothetical protein